MEDASVDAVVSFETLEHLREHSQFVVEVRRVLRPGGRLIISTPDRTIYSAQHFNQFHMLELTYVEFKSLLRSKFANVAISHQRAILGSLITFLEVTGYWCSYELRDPEHIEASNGLSRAPYLIGIASESELPQLRSSAYVDQRSAWEAAHALARTLELELQLDDVKSRAAELESQRDEFQSALVDHRVRAADVERGQECRVRAAEEAVELKNAQLAEFQRSLAEAEHKFLQLMILKDEHTRLKDEHAAIGWP